MHKLTGNPNQLEAIKHTAGAAQVLAGPGSGKTFVTVWRIYYLITQQKVPPSDILVITFTKAAAAEMQSRFFQLTAPEKPAVWFGTFHAVFYHILKHSVNYQDYSIVTKTEKRKLLKKIVSLQIDFPRIQEEDYDRLLEAFAREKKGETEFTIPLAEMTREQFVYLFTEFHAYLKEEKQIDFDDIMSLCEQLLEEEKTIRVKWQKQFRYILIDEFQDIAPVQYRIMKLLALPENNLFVVGDDDQSIYRFRGASPEMMQQFLRDYPARQILLDTNYRCHEQIVETALLMIGENKNRFFKRIRANHNRGSGIHCRIFDTEEEENCYLIQKMRECIAQGILEECAVISRTHYECALFARVLEKEKIPYRLKEKTTNRFSHFVIQDLLAYLRLGMGERKRNLFLRILNRPVRYLRRDSLTEENISEQGWLAFYQGKPKLQQEIGNLFRKLGTLQGYSPYLAIRYVRQVIGYDRYLRERYGVKEQEKLLKIAGEFQEFAREYSTMEELLIFMEQYGEICQKQETSTKPEKGITLLTMHGAKGLEYTKVFIPGCEEGKIPSKKAVTEEDMEEERRLLYVAFTRAREDLYVTAVKGKTGKEIPSRFLTIVCEKCDKQNAEA